VKSFKSLLLEEPKSSFQFADYDPNDPDHQAKVEELRQLHAPSGRVPVLHRRSNGVYIKKLPPTPRFSMKEIDRDSAHFDKLSHHIEEIKKLTRPGGTLHAINDKYQGDAGHHIDHVHSMVAAATAHEDHEDMHMDAMFGATLEHDEYDDFHREFKKL
jgi:hypothetical protein